MLLTGFCGCQNTTQNYATQKNMLTLALCIGTHRYGYMEKFSIKAFPLVCFCIIQLLSLKVTVKNETQKNFLIIRQRKIFICSIFVTTWDGQKHCLQKISIYDTYNACLLQVVKAGASGTAGTVLAVPLFGLEIMHGQSVRGQRTW